MPKKTKLAKGRLDKFYSMAKDMGYRSRAAFKLVQINRKFDFLSKCRTVVDLCGAPGSWSQVCAKQMPASSTIICVDLVKIASIPGVKGVQGDITTLKTQNKVRSLLEKRKCEAVIHDGAPNVGGTWDKDAFAQNWLTLKAIEFACGLLQADGWFVTKVFRSRDYTKLLWVLHQLFDKVEQFKPAASRQQSAEVFVVCAGYKAPKRVDPKLFSQSIFDHNLDDQQVDATDPMGRIAAKNASKVPEGYQEGKTLLYWRAPAGDLFDSEDPKKFVQAHNEIYWGDGDEELRDHRFTTKDIIESFKDLKVISVWDENNIVKWVKRIKREREETVKEIKDTEKEAERLLKAERGEADDDEEKDPEEILKEIQDLRRREVKAKKRSERKLVDKKLLLAERLGYNPGDHHDAEEGGQANNDEEMFRHSSFQLLNAKAEIGEDDYDNHADIGKDTKIAGYEIHKRDKQGRDTVMDVDADDEIRNEGGREADDEDEEMEEGEEEEEDGPEEKTIQTTGDYYRQLEAVLDRQYRGKEEYDTDEDSEKEVVEKVGEPQKWAESSESDDTSTESDGDGDSDDDQAQRHTGGKRRRLDEAGEAAPGGGADDEGPETVQKQAREERKSVTDKKRKKKNAKGGFEEVPRPMLDPETRGRTLAIAAQMLDRKRKRDILEDGIHRYTFGEENLPRWFVEDERIHNVRFLPVTKAEVEEQKARWREVNARPAKKVAEAMARRRRRASTKLKGILIKEKADPRKNSSAGLTLRKLMRSSDLRYKGKAKHQQKEKGGDNRSKAEKRGARKREKFNKKRGGKK